MYPVLPFSHSYPDKSCKQSDVSFLPFYYFTEYTQSVCKQRLVRFGDKNGRVDSLEREQKKNRRRWRAIGGYCYHYFFANGEKVNVSHSHAGHTSYTLFWETVQSGISYLYFVQDCASFATITTATTFFPIYFFLRATVTQVVGPSLAPKKMCCFFSQKSGWMNGQPEGICQVSFTHSRKHIQFLWKPFFWSIPEKVKWKMDVDIGLQ